MSDVRSRFLSDDLFGRGDAGRRTLPMTAEELLESAMLIYLQGLGFSQKPDRT